MVQMHPQARTTPVVRADIARSTEPVRVVAKRYGISEETRAQVAQTRRTGGPGSIRPTQAPGLADD